MRAFIYIGGEVCAKEVTEHPRGDDLVIAADSGWHNALLLGERPQILVGDFDSIGEPLPEDVEVYQVPAEKNETDTQLAVSLAITKGAKEIILVGGLSGRLDHTLSNLGILEDLARQKIRGVISDGRNRVRFLCNDGTLLPRSSYRYFSLIAVTPVVRGVSIDGCKYPLKNARLTRENQYAVSNEIEGNCALVEVRKGAVYLIESKNPDALPK